MSFCTARGLGWGGSCGNWGRHELPVTISGPLSTLYTTAYLPIIFSYPEALKVAVLETPSKRSNFPGTRRRSSLHSPRSMSSSIGRRAALLASSSTRASRLSALSQRRWAGHGAGPHYNEPSGHLFGEKVRLGCTLVLSSWSRWRSGCLWFGYVGCMT